MDKSSIDFRDVQNQVFLVLGSPVSSTGSVFCKDIDDILTTDFFQ